MSTKKLQVIDYIIKQAENADTVDNKHASDFAGATDMATAQSDISDLQAKVGDTTVSDQISTAIKNKSDVGHTHDEATTSVAGFMSASDKTKLDGIATGATATTIEIVRW